VVRRFVCEIEWGLVEYYRALVGLGRIWVRFVDMDRSRLPAEEGGNCNFPCDEVKTQLLQPSFALAPRSYETSIMASPGRNQPGQPRPRARRSIANVPTSEAGIQQENMTADLSALQDTKRAATQTERKKSRSKSLGPGGLDALKDEIGNRRKVMVVYLP
jgi:hypothetical protein